MSQLTKAQVQAVAALANLELEPDEVELFAKQLGDVLTHVEELKQIDTTGVSPTTFSYEGGAAEHSVDRPDAVKPSLSVDDVIANAPEREKVRDGGFFKVPRIL